MAQRTASQSRSRVFGRPEDPDSLELLDPDVQEAYYKQLIHRYMRFCSINSKELDAAFLSLPRNRSDDPTTNPPVAMAPPGRNGPHARQPSRKPSSDSPAASSAPAPQAPALPSHRRSFSRSASAKLNSLRLHTHGSMHLPIRTAPWTPDTTSTTAGSPTSETAAAVTPAAAMAAVAATGSASSVASPTSKPASNEPTPPGTANPAQSREQMLYMASIELSTILLSLRKLREAILATGSHTNPAFARRVHSFCVRTGLLARHPPSYFPPLKGLVRLQQHKFTALEQPEAGEFTTYMILDYACRQDDLEGAIALRKTARHAFGYTSSLVDDVLHALIHDDWILFWRARNSADGYCKALIEWAADDVRRNAIRAVGKSYLQVPLEYLVATCAGEGGNSSWEQLAEKEQLGWQREGDKVLIRIRKKQPAPPAASAAAAAAMAPS
ncbi:hypothetical protein KEM52_004593 [Ascosphaera acerosa]|nr:hypothetical protein KEM52_004593 [Ascosphaera acerosa]